MKKLLFPFLVLALLIFCRPILFAQDTVWTGYYPGYINNAIFSPDDSKILVSGNNAFLEVNPLNGSIIRSMPPIGRILGLSNDKRFIITDSMKLRNAENYSIAKDFAISIKQLGNPWKIAYDSSLKIFGFLYQHVYPSLDSIVFTDGISSSIINTFNTDTLTDRLYDFIISPDGKYFVTCSVDMGTVQKVGDEENVLTLWSMETYKIIKELKREYSNTLWNIQFSPDGTILAVNLDSKLELYSIPNGDLKEVLKITSDYGNNIHCFTFSSDSKFIYLGGEGIITKLNLNIINKDFDIKYLYSYQNINISINTKYIISGNHSQLFLFNDGITEVEEPKTDTIIVFPNPTNNIVTISINCTNLLQHYKIFNSSGYLLQTTNIEPNSNQVTIDFSSNPSGIYFVYLFCGTSYLTYKIVKE